MNEIQAKQIEVLKGILSDYFDDKHIKVDSEDPEILINFPQGVLIRDKDGWGISVDYAMTQDSMQILTIMNIMQRSYASQIPLVVYVGFHSVFCDEGVCAGVVDQSDVIALWIEEDMDVEEALETLSQDLIDGYCEECTHSQVDADKVH